jgi:predicted DNA-binding transcriptional regulator YafY
VPSKITVTVGKGRPDPKPKRRASRQVIRLLTVIRMLTEGKRPKPHELAKSMGVSLRTILRDLNTLEQIGIPLRGDASGRRMVLELAPGSRETITAPPFTERESVALLWASLPNLHNQPVGIHLHRAARKLGLLAQQGESARDVTRMFQVVVSTAGPLPVQATSESVLMKLIACSLSGIRCRLQFSDTNPGETWEVEPLFILCSEKEPFLIGRRTGVLFSLPAATIADVSETAGTFTPPEKKWILKTAQGWFSAEPGPRMKVVVRFAASARKMVERFTIHPTQETVALRDGRTELRFVAEGGSDIVQWVLGWGDLIEVLAPLSLRKAVRSKLAAALLAYDR